MATMRKISDRFLVTILVGLLLLLGYHHGYMDPLYKPQFLTKAEQRQPAVSPDENYLSQTVFVTALDASHFEESKDSIASLQTYLPLWHRIIFYDLGLSKPQVEQVKHWCRVSYVKFNVTKYPPHVSNLRCYAFKPLIIQEVLQDHEAVVWFDASVRFKVANIVERIGPALKENGISMVVDTGVAVSATTHPGMYAFLSTNMTYLQQVQYGATAIFILKTTDMLESVMKPWVNCSLTKECINPTGAGLRCKFKKDKPKAYAHCHRYDQSALNIILFDYFRGNASLFHTPNTVLSVIRHVTKMFKLQVC